MLYVPCHAITMNLFFCITYQYVWAKVENFIFQQDVHFEIEFYSRLDKRNIGSQIKSTTKNFVAKFIFFSILKYILFIENDNNEWIVLLELEILSNCWTIDWLAGCISKLWTHLWFVPTQGSRLHTTWNDYCIFTW